MSTLKVGAIRGVSASSDAITVANDGSCTAKITNNLSNRNLIINGAMQFAQRGTSNNTGTDGYFTVDRIYYNSSGLDNNATTSQADVASGTTPYTLGFRKCFKVTNANQSSGAGSSDKIEFRQRLEAHSIANSGWNYKSDSSYITLSFWVKSSVAQNFYFYMLANDGTQQNFPMETGSLSADTWTKITKTIPGNTNVQFDNDVNEGMTIVWDIFRGTDQTAGTVSLDTWAAFSSSARTPDQTSTWYTTNGATFEITGMQLEVGSVATDFEFRLFGDELLRCQRYYQISVSESQPGVLAGRGTGTSTVHCSVPLACSMRAVPSLSDSDFSQVYAYLYDSRPHNGSSGTVTTNSSQFNSTGAYLTINVGGFGGNIDDDRVVNIGGYATNKKLILNSEF